MKAQEQQSYFNEVCSDVDFAVDCYPPKMKVAILSMVLAKCMSECENSISAMNDSANIIKMFFQKLQEQGYGPKPTQRNSSINQRKIIE